MTQVVEKSQKRLESGSVPLKFNQLLKEPHDQPIMEL